MDYQLAVKVLGVTTSFTGSVTANGPVSPECTPKGSLPGNEFQHGALIAQFGYPSAIDFNTDVNNCGACGIVCPASSVCRNGYCVRTGELRITLVSWSPNGEMDLYVFPPQNNSRVTWDSSGPGEDQAWGTMDVESELLGRENGPENVFWDSTQIIQGQSRPPLVGTYTVVRLHFCASNGLFRRDRTNDCLLKCVDTTSFIQAITPANPVILTLEIANATHTRRTNATFTFDTTQNVSAECHPVNRVSDEFFRGGLVTIFQYPAII